jgi:TrmH family RNA methyltransferase
VLLELAEGRSSGLLTALFDLPPLLSAAELLARRPAPAVYLVAVDVEEPGNVGALIRTALASDAAGLICVGATDPFHPKAVRTSLGSLFKLPLARAGSTASELFSELRAAQVHSLAAVARDGQALHEGVWPSGSVAIVVGSESRGLSERWREDADGRVSIDFCRAADSFGVNAAAAVCLYEVQRRLRSAPVSQ